jgi:hypothetical protein
MAGLEDKAVELIGQLQALSPQLTDVALETARLGALSWPVTGLIASVIGIILFRCARAMFSKMADASYEDEVGFRVVGVMFSIGTTICGIIALAGFTNLYAWVGIWHPEIYLASRVLS